MRKSEKLLLAAVGGLGLLLSVTYLPGKGRERRAPVQPLPQPSANEGVAKALPPPATLELLATHRVELKPLVPGMRNPFRPAQGQTEAAITCVAVAIEVTGFFGEGHELAALVKGEIVQDGKETKGLTIVHFMVRERALADLLRGTLSSPTPEEARLLALVKGKLVRAGEAVGGLTVVGISPGEVELECDGERYRLKFHTRPTKPGEAGEPSSAAEPRRTESAN